MASRRQFTSVDSSIVKGPIRLRDSRGQNLAADTDADTNSCERLYQALFWRATNIREYESDAKIRPDRRLHTSARTKFRGDARRRAPFVSSKFRARSCVYFARPSIAISKIRDYSQSRNSQNTDYFSGHPKRQATVFQGAPDFLTQTKRIKSLNYQCCSMKLLTLLFSVKTFTIEPSHLKY